MVQFMEDLAVFTTLNHSGYLGKNFIEIKKKLCYFPAKGRSVQRKTITGLAYGLGQHF